MRLYMPTIDSFVNYTRSKENKHDFFYDSVVLI